VWPGPSTDLWQILTMLFDVPVLFEQHAVQARLHSQTFGKDRRQSVEGIDDQMKSINVVAYGHVEWRRCAAFLREPTNVQIVMVVATIRQPMDQQRITATGKDDWCAGARDMWMLALWLQTHQVDNVDDTNAVQNGELADTSMGVTPSSALPMGNRPGDRHPGLVDYLTRTQNMNVAELNKMITAQSGLNPPHPRCGIATSCHHDRCVRSDHAVFAEGCRLCWPPGHLEECKTDTR